MILPGILKRVQWDSTGPQGRTSATIHLPRNPMPVWFFGVMGLKWYSKLLRNQKTMLVRKMKK
jgi:hypothetical protein